MPTLEATPKTTSGGGSLVQILRCFRVGGIVVNQIPIPADLDRVVLLPAPGTGDRRDV